MEIAVQIFDSALHWIITNLTVDAMNGFTHTPQSYGVLNNDDGSFGKEKST